LSYWRTYTGLEVDFIVGKSLAVEVKATTRVRETDLLPLRTLHAQLKIAQRIIVCQEPIERITADGIMIMPVEVFLQQLWTGQFHVI